MLFSLEKINQTNFFWMILQCDYNQWNRYKILLQEYMFSRFTLFLNTTIKYQEKCYFTPKEKSRINKFFCTLFKVIKNPALFLQFCNIYKTPKELDAGLLTVLKVKSVKNVRNLKQMKLILTYIFCLRLLGLDQNNNLAKFSCILFRKSTFKTTFVILHEYCNPHYLVWFHSPLVK